MFEDGLPPTAERLCKSDKVDGLSRIALREGILCGEQGALGYQQVEIIQGAGATLAQCPIEGCLAVDSCGAECIASRRLCLNPGQRILDIPEGDADSLFILKPLRRRDRLRGADASLALPLAATLQMVLAAEKSELKPLAAVPKVSGMRKRGKRSATATFCRAVATAIRRSAARTSGRSRNT